LHCLQSFLYFALTELCNQGYLLHLRSSGLGFVSLPLVHGLIGGLVRIATSLAGLKRKPGVACSSVTSVACFLAFEVLETVLIADASDLTWRLSAAISERCAVVTLRRASNSSLSSLRATRAISVLREWINELMWKMVVLKHCDTPSKRKGGSGN
jgi:hypothetical protein